MALSRVQFESVNSGLNSALLGVRKSKVVDDGTVFNAVIAKEELDAPGRDYSKDPASAINPVALGVLTTFLYGQVNGYGNWFHSIDGIWRELEDIRVAFVFDRGQFNQVLGELEPDLLDSLAEIFLQFGETISPTRLTNESGPVYRRIVLNQGNHTFPEIAQHCRELVDHKRSSHYN